MTEEFTFEQRFDKALKGVGLDSVHREEDPTEIIETVEQDPDTSKKTAEVRSPTPINLFQHPDAHPLALDLALLRRYGPEWLLWEPETLEIQVPRDFRTNSLSSINLEKLMAVKTLHVADGFWSNWEVFSACVNPLNGMFADFTFTQAPHYGEILVAYDIAQRIRADIQLSDEVTGYIKVAMQFDGVLCPIDPLSAIQPDVSAYPIDVSVIEGAWDAVRQIERAPQGNTVEDEQLRRMLDAHRYLVANRQRLAEQLPLVLQT